MEKQGSINKRGIRWHKRRVLMHRLKNRARKAWKNLLEVLEILGTALVILFGMWGTAVLAILFF